MRIGKMLAILCLPVLCAHGVADAASCVSPNAPVAAPVSAKSGTTSATIIELYTSEGCDSCPPADKWFSTVNYARDGVVPLAFHVDYWDYIGWKDRFAKPDFTQRQRDAVVRQGSRVSYTPQLMLDGRDLRVWSHQAQFQSRLREVSIRMPRATLALEAAATDKSVEAALSATIAFPQDRTDAAFFLAVTESNLISRVTAGENKGVLLKHDHVVRDLIGPIPIEAGDRAAGKFSVKRTLALAPDWKRSDLSIVAFVQNGKNGEVLQALSTPICRS